MPKPYDTTAKDLLESDPEAWVAYLGLRPDGPVEVIDADLATITAEADKVFRIGGPEPYIVHVEMQVSADTTLPRRLLRYNVLLDYRHQERVWSTVILLRPVADSPHLTGSLELRLPDGRRVLDFRYGVVRAWEQSAEAILRGPLGTLPMALLADAPAEAARSIVERIDQRLLEEAPVAEAARVMTSTFLLAGLRVEHDQAPSLFLGVRTMNLLDSKILEASSTWPLLVERYEALKVRSVIERLGTIRFGPPDAASKQALEAISDLEHLDALVPRVITAASWEELLAPDQGP